MNHSQYRCVCRRGINRMFLGQGICERSRVPVLRVDVPAGTKSGRDGNRTADSPLLGTKSILSSFWSLLGRCSGTNIVGSGRVGRGLLDGEKKKGWSFLEDRSISFGDGGVRIRRESRSISIISSCDLFALPLQTRRGDCKKIDSCRLQVVS